ncbi:negative transcriptional regulator [Thozetella sp. PMI_491]|nr:negative transcriptional regulator [Thozetella sp. PMI_491]
MYLRGVHAESSTRVLRKIIQENPLGLLTTAISSPNYPLLQSSHIPFLIDVQDEADEKELGVLRGHMARANPHSKAMIETLTEHPKPGSVLEQEVLVIFTAAAHHYVTPKFYVETKPETGKVVPTWNYAAAQVYGRAKIYFDSGSEETSQFLAQQIRDLSQHSESKIMGYTGKDGRPEPWTVSQAPERYVDLLKKSIIGIEIAIDRLEGKFKMSQEMGKGDRDGVIEGFASLDSDVGREISKTVQERGAMKDAAKAR